MASPTDLTARIHIVLEIDRPGPEMEQLADGVAKVQVRIAEINQVQNTYRTTVKSTTASVRYLLLNLRMFSFGIRTLRRQFGDTSPALEAFANGLMTLAAVGTSAISGVELLRGAVGRLGPALAGMNFATVIGGAKILIGLLGGPVGVVAGFAALVAVPVAAWAMESASGISALRREAKSLELDLKMLEFHLKSLRAEQDKFNLGMSATQIQMRELKRAIDLAGGSNKALESQLAALSAEYENMAIASMKAKLEQDTLNISITETKAVNDDLLRQENAIRMARMRGGVTVGREALLEAMRREGVTGRPSMRAMQEAMTAGRERGPAGLGGIGQALSVIINFPGAIFNTEGDIEGALQSGAEKVGRIIYNQYGAPGVQR